MPEENTEKHLQTFGIYSPGSMPKKQLLSEFIARRRQLDTALGIVRDNKAGEPQQHLLVVGPRGMGKTMLLLALSYRVEDDPELGREWLPVIFPEESYGIGDLADFWLSAAGHLLAAMGKEAEFDEIEELRNRNPDDIEDQARELFLRHLEPSGKRAMLVLENLDDFFGAVSDEAEQHRLRAFLMEDDRVMIAASSTSYFEETGRMDMPFYDFFRTIRLERLNRDEMVEMLTELAGVREDGDRVMAVIEKEPGRIETLRVLTGGNPRLVKMVYRMLAEGGAGSARRDLDRLLEDCTPYFKHRIEEIRSNEERRAFDHVAKSWDPVTVGDVAKALRRPPNKASIYLSRLADAGFLEEAPASAPKRKAYQVAERFYNIYYLMRFSRSGRRRLEWLVQGMRVFYSADDFHSWVKRTLEDWRLSEDPGHREDREAFLYSLTKASESAGIQRELARESIAAAWDHDQLASLNRLLDRDLGKQALGGEFDLIEFLAGLPQDEREALGYRPKDSRWWFALGYALQTDHGQYNFAGDAYRKAIELDPQDASPWNGLGNLLKNHLGPPAEAEEAYRKAIELNPNYATPWRNLGVLFMEHLGRPGDAEVAYRKASELDPQDASPWNGLGNLLKINLGRPAEAEEAYRKAIELDPDYASPWNGLGNLLMEKLDRTAEAEDAYRKAIKLDPKSAPSFAGLASLLNLSEREEEAADSATRGLLLDPKPEWIRNTFLDICSEDAGRWLEVLPSLLDQIAATDEEVHALVVRGLEFVVGTKALAPEAAIEMIATAGADEPLADIVLALHAVDDRSVLAKASPERRAFAEDFLKRLEGGTKAREAE